VRANLHHNAPLHHSDSVRVPDRGQAVGNDDDGGVIFQNFEKGGKVQMFQVNKDGKTIGKKETQAYEGVLVSVDLPSGAQALFDGLEELQPKSVQSDELHAFAVHDLRLTAQLKAAKEVRKEKLTSAVKAAEQDADAEIPTIVKLTQAEQKAALTKFRSGVRAQKSVTIGIIDKSQALSGTNDFAKNVHRAIAIGAWTDAELDQFYDRMCRAPQPGEELVQGDLVAKVRHGVHITSPFAANLLAKTEDRAVVVELPEDVKKALEALEPEEEEGEEEDKEDEKGEDKRLRKVKTLLAMDLSNNPAGKYIECLQDEKAKEEFKEGKYMPVIKGVFAGLEEE